MSEQCQRILAKVTEARARYEEGTLGKIDGADAHKFQLQSPLAEDELVACEAKTSMQIPPEFRAFLLNVGRSRAGPGYGIFCSPDTKSIRWWLYPHCESPEKDELIAQFQMPCRLREGMTLYWVFEQFGPDWDMSDPNDAAQDPYGGTIAITYHDTLIFDAIILNGPYIGRLCRIDALIDTLHIPVAPLFAPETNFLDWYENWLDLVLTSANIDYDLHKLFMR